jgi:hypothetical protein
MPETITEGLLWVGFYQVLLLAGFGVADLIIRIWEGWKS